MRATTERGRGGPPGPGARRARSAGIAALVASSARPSCPRGARAARRTASRTAARRRTARPRPACTSTAVAEPEGFAGARPHQRAVRLLEAEIIGAEGRGGNEAVGAGFLSWTNRPTRVTPAMRAEKRAPTCVSQMRGDQPVHRFAFGRHRAPLGAGNVLGDVGEFAPRRVLEPARARASRRGSARDGRSRSA